VHLRHERAGRIDRGLSAARGPLVDRRGNTVSREHEDRPGRGLRLVLDEDRSSLLQLTHDVRVVDDLPAHENRRAVERERTLDRFHGALYSGAISPGRCKQDPLNQTGGHGSSAHSRRPFEQEKARRSGGSLATGLLLVLTADCKARNAPRFASPSRIETNGSYRPFQ